MRKYLLKEMAIYDEDEVFSQNAVASVSTEEVQDLEGDDLTICVYKKINTIRIPENYHLQPTDIGTIVKHHCTHRNKKKAALLALPAIINAQYITQPWRKKTTDGKVQRSKDKRPSGMVSAPILIDGVKYLCNITQKLALNGDIFPYTLTLKDENGNIIEGEKMDSTLKVPDSNSKYTTSGHTHFDEVTTSPDTNPSIYANLSKKDISVNINSDRSGGFLSATRYNHGADYVSESRITNENKRYKNMDRKNTIRLTESELKQIITESVRNIISELDWKTYANAASAAKDRESIFKDDPGYPYRPMVRHYKDDGSLDMEKYQRDSDWQVNQSKQPEKFRQAAYRELSREICGEDDFALFLAKYIPLHGVDDKLQKMLQQYQEGEKYIKNNKTQWSKRR